MRLRVKGAYPMELSNTFRPAIELDASSSANQAFKTQKSMHVEA